MRIAVLHNTGPGGALRMVIEVASRLAEVDAVTVATWNDDPDPPIAGVEQVHRPVTGLRLPPPFHPFGDLARSWVGSRRVARWVDDHDFDVVLGFACQWAQAPEALRVLATPTVYFAQEGRRRAIEPHYTTRAARGGGFARRLGTAAYDQVGKAMDRHAMKGEFLLATNSAFTARRLRDAYGRRAIPVTLGVDSRVFRPVAGPGRAHAVLCVGALEPMKNQLLAVEALGLMPADDRPELRLVFNRGSDDYRDLLERRARDLGVTVVLRESIDDEELAREYCSVRALLATAVDEPFGLTVPEASATGTPVVAVRSGGFVETVMEGVNGVLVEPAAPALAAATTDLLAGRTAVAADLPAWAAARWSWDRCTDEIRSLCESVARRR